MLMIKNCKAYNEPMTPYYEAAESLEAFINTQFSISNK